MDSNIVITHDAKVRINEKVFAVRRPRVRVEGQLFETSQTEDDNGDDGVFMRESSDRLQLIAELEFYEDTSVVYFTPFGMGIQEGQSIDFKFYNRGLGSPPFHAPKFVLSHFEISGDIDSPLHGSLAGKSDGKFTKPV